MKVLKSLAVFAAIFTLGACKTAPGDGGGSSLEAALGEALGGLGGTAGLTRYNHQSTEVEGGATYTKSYSLFINTADPKEIKEAQAVFQDGGTMEGTDGNDYPVGNQLHSQGSFIYGSITAATPAGITAVGYKFYKSIVSQSKGKQYDPAKKDFIILTDTAANISVGEIYYFAIKEEGSQITVKKFFQTLPTDQTAFDSESTTIYKK